MDVIDARDYSIIVGTDWLTKMRATITFDPPGLTIQQEGKTVTVPCTQLKERKLPIVKVQEEEEDSSDSESKSEEEEEEAYTYITFTGEEKKNSWVLFNKEGIIIHQKLFTWAQYLRLKEMMNKKSPKKANWDYAPWGPLARCWCGHRLYSPEDERIGCIADYRKWELLKVIPRQEVEEAYQKADKEDDNWQ